MSSDTPSIKSGIQALLRGAAPILIFYVFDLGWSLRAAIVASALWSIGEVALRLSRGQKIDSLFKFSAVTTLVFGGLDLLITQPRFFSYEAVVTNLVTGSFFLMMASSDITPLLKQAKAMQPGLEIDADMQPRMRLAVSACGLCCFGKALLYAWVAIHFPVEKAMAIRSVVGTATMVLFMVVLNFTLDPMLHFFQRRGFLKPAPAPAEASVPVPVVDAQP